MKKCTKCGETKPRSEFHKQAASPDGLRSRCKSCRKTHDKTYKNPLTTPDELMEVYKVCSDCGEASPLENFNKQAQGRWGRHNMCRPCSKGTYREWSKDNPAKVTAKNAKWAKDNPAKNAAKTNLRNARKKNCCPMWLTKDHLKEIELIYFDSQQMKDLTGVAYHVDHIVPIGNQQIYKSMVCGLHVPWNLQLLTATENLRKSDNFCLDTAPPT